MAEQSRTVQQLLDLRMPPIGVGFLDERPEDIPRWHGGSVPAGCSFWTKAMAGATFYTVPSDHYGCAVGCHTHALPLPPARRAELTDAAELMVEAGYLLPADVLSMPALSKTPAAVAYGPVEAAPFRVDVVLLSATPAQGMLIYESLLRLGEGQMMTAPALGRPACSLLPFVSDGTRTALSFGCKGNRTFTDLPDDQLFFGVPGSLWARFVETLDRIVTANETMARYYKGRQTPGER